LNMIRKVFYGDAGAAISGGQDIKRNERLALVIIVMLILGVGIYPQPVLNITNEITDSILRISDMGQQLKK
jgi:NADH-quinone oxidoreductase subunit M